MDSEVYMILILLYHVTYLIDNYIYLKQRI